MLHNLRNYSSLPIFLASVGFVWQVHLISKVYFQYTTQVDIMIEIPFKISMPALTICTIIDDVLRKEDKSELIFLPINEISTFSQPEVEIICKVPAPELGQLKGNKESSILCENITPSKDTIQLIRNHLLARCTTYFSRNLTQPSMDVITSDAKDFYQISFDKIKNTTVYFYVHNPVEMIHVTEADTITLNIFQLQEVVLSTTKFTTNFLPSPYPTNCRDYDEFENGRWGCLFQCRIKQLTKQCSLWPKNVPASLNVKWPFQTIYANCSSTVDEHYCYNKICSQKPCWGQWYTTTTIYTRERINQIDKSVIYIRRPSGVEFTFNYIPKLAQIEYICYVASCFGIWFGVSCADFLRLIRTSFQFEGEQLTDRLPTNKPPTDNKIISIRRGKINCVDNVDIRRQFTSTKNRMLF